MNCYKKIMVGSDIDLNIESLSFGGKGVARTAEGKVAFVPYVIPGEEVTAKIVRERSSYIVAMPTTIRRSSCSRTAPLCSWFETCGGCDWQHIKYSDQVMWKQEIIENHLRKANSADYPEYCEPVSSPKEYGYRDQLRLHSDGRITGFFMKESNDIVNIDDCLLANERIRRIMPLLKEHVLKRLSAPVFSLEAVSLLGRLQLVLHLRKGLGKKLLDEIKSVCRDLEITGIAVFDVESRRHDVIGDGCFEYTTKTDYRELRIRGGLGGFFQANQHVNQTMVDHVVSLAGEGENALDLYCGCGNFALPLATRFTRVVAVDHDRRLLEYVVRNAHENGIDNMDAMRADSKEGIFRLSAMMQRFDAIVMDPPRSGARDIINEIGRLKAGRVIYVSCNPPALSRDIMAMRPFGYRLKSVRLFDMFPQTHHIEAVACLEC